MAVARTVALVAQETQVPQKCLVGEVFLCSSELENVEQRGWERRRGTDSCISVCREIVT